MPPLARLGSLTHLKLHGIKPATSLRLLQDFTQLQSLQLGRWPFPTKAEALSNLTGLTQLVLDQMHDIRLGMHLAALTHLRVFHLLDRSMEVNGGGTGELSLQWMEHMKQLQEVKVRTALLHAKRLLLHKQVNLHLARL